MSAGTPQRNKRQAQAQRQAYMNSLRLEASNIQKNYNANEIYKATGTASIPKSTETATDKASSMEGRKQLIKEALVSAGIMNSFVADNFLADLTDDDLTFFLSHQQAILEGFKPKNVPAQVFRAYFKKYEKKFAETLGIDYGLQTGGGADFGLDATLMVKALSENREALEAMKAKLDATFDRATASQYKGQVDALLAKMPTQEEFERIQAMEDADAREDALRVLSEELEQIGDLGDVLQRFNDLDRSKLPDEARILDVFSQREEAIRRRQQQEALEEEMRRVREASIQTEQQRKIEDLLRTTTSKATQLRGSVARDLPLDEDELFDIGLKLGVDQDILDSGDDDLIRNAIQRVAVERDAGVGEPVRGEVDEGVSAELPLEGFFRLPAEYQELYTSVADEIPSPEAFIQRPADTRRRIINSLGQSLQDKSGNANVFPIEAEGRFVSAGELLSLPLKTQENAIRTMTPPVKQRRAKSPSARRDLSTGDDVREARARASADQVGGVPPAGGATDLADALTGNGMRGRGLGRSKPKTPVEKSDGYEKPVQYTQFGRYLIHHPKLKQGILQLKTPKGGAIKALPTEYLTPRLKETMLTLVGNGSPSLEQFDRLTADEKEKLHHITKHSQYEKVSIPRGHMDKEDQMLHKFTILKGELLAGNNSKQLLKEFKSMLIKFVEEGRIPRRQANEILIELAKEGM
jgi:hypothetical protein